MRNDKKAPEKSVSLAPTDKLILIGGMPEMVAAVKIMMVAMQEVEAESYIRFGYSFQGENYEVVFQKVRKETHA